MKSSAPLHPRPTLHAAPNMNVARGLRGRTWRGRRKFRAPSLSVCFRVLLGVYFLLLISRGLSGYDDYAKFGVSDHPVLEGYLHVEQPSRHPRRGGEHTSGVEASTMNLLPSCAESRSNLLKRDPSRIPAYFLGCQNTTFYGFVFRDLVNRLLPPQWTLLNPFAPSSRQNRVLVLSSNAATRALKEMTDPAWTGSRFRKMEVPLELRPFSKLAPRTRWADDETDLQRRYDYNLGASIAIAAKARGYQVDALGIESRDLHKKQSLDDFWRKLLAKPSSSTNRSTTNNSGVTVEPTTIDQNGALLVFFDPPEIGQEDDVITQMSSLSFLQESPIEYVVYRVSMTKNERYGEDASLQLLEAGFQLQILSASHDAVDNSGDTHSHSISSKLRRLKVNPRYGPNTMLFDETTVKRYFSYGQKVIADFSERKAASKINRNDGNSDDDNNDDYPFLSYIFATRGLDLAIPSTQEYINLTGMEEADVVLNVDASLIPYRSCRRSGNGRQLAKISWGDINTTGSGGELTSLVQIVCPAVITQIRNSAANASVNKKSYDLWQSAPNSEDSEALCVTCRNPATFVNSKFGIEPSLTCTTRFLARRLPSPKTQQEISRQKSPSRNVSIDTEKQAIHETLHNILFVELESMSRERFDKLMPLTKAALLNGGLWPMKNYIAADFSGGMNYEFFGFKRRNGTNLWNQLGEAGYDVLRGRNGCLLDFESHYQYRNYTFYGAGLNRMFCDKKLIRTRPNCYGGKSAASHLLDYSTEFIEYHRKAKLPWAAFLSFVEGNEDSAMLPGTIDSTLSRFFTKLKESILDGQWEQTLVVFASQSGQSRGAYFNSLKGQTDFVKPVLFLKGASRQDRATLIMNENRYITPYDLHRTIHRLIIRDEDEDTSGALSILMNLPEDRAHCRQILQINSAICDFEIDRMEEESKYVAIASGTPSSILSFYADIPKQSRNHVAVTMNPSLRERTSVSEGCHCATNTNKWFPCNEHPWDKTSVQNFREYFMLVECPGQATHIEIRALQNPVLLKRSDMKIPKKLSKPLPNVIFLELDSVSESYANRHFTRTRELLQKYRVRSTAQGYKCFSGFCSADFSNRISLVGAHSIPNQVAALSGCLSSDFEHACGHEEPAPNLFCDDPSEPHYGLQIHRVRLGARQIYWCPPQPERPQRLTPWLFSVTDSLGYINFFGEEFCFEGSPYVTQGNIFPAFFADIEPHRAFCRLAEQRIRRQNKTVLDEFRWSYERQDQACVDSFAHNCTYEKARISLELIEQMWSVYPTRPKMAFLSVLAAHVYNSDWSRLFLMAERYDDTLAHFLETMLLRPDIQNTIFIIRSDHGLQRGPMAMDYSLQVEHTRPWTELLIPESLLTHSKKALFENQERLISGHDIYRTIRSLMFVDETEEPYTLLAPFANNWTFDLLSMPIPDNRTCKDARVDESLCREESIVPSFGICNVLDPKQKKFCRDYIVKPLDEGD